MTATLSMILRHPIKSIGREALDEVTLRAGEWMPHDRIWGVTHERSQLDGPGWARKVNFLRGVSGPSLMAVTCAFEPTSGRVRLAHPRLDPIEFRPDRLTEPEPVLAWLRDIWPDDMPRPTGFFRAEGAHLSDAPDPWISINSTASLRAFSQRTGTNLSPHRFRGNLWIDGLAPWEEFEWVGRRIRIGGVTFDVKAPITRCKATMANPETGRRDVDTLGALEELGHQEFGVYAEVVEGGRIALGDAVAA